MNMLAKVEAYILENQKMPARRSKDTTIKKMGTWISTQQKNYNKKTEIMKKQEIYNSWTVFMKKYEIHFKSNEEWHIMLGKIEKYILENQKKPPRRSHDKNIKKMGEWISRQQKNYNKKTEIMKNQQIYDTWTEFIATRIKYFKSNKINANVDKTIDDSIIKS